MRQTAVLITALFLFFSPYAFAEEKSASPNIAPAVAGAVDEAKAADIKTLIEMTTTDNFIKAWTEGFMRVFADMAMAGGSEDEKKEITAISDTVTDVMTTEYPKLAEKLTALYDKYYSHEEIKELIAFYKSPVGRKTIEILPALTAESMKLGVEWGKALMPLIEERLTEKGVMQGK